MKIYTKTGDEGKTSLFGGRRVLKSHDRIDAYGTVDELNAFIGLLMDKMNKDDHHVLLKEVQERLFTIGANLASDPEKELPSKVDLQEADILKLEAAMDAMNEELPPLKNFILPGGHEAVSICHVARCVCRRAERMTVQLAEKERVDVDVIKYLNRLSDYLFVLARNIGKDFGVAESKWMPRT